jgi:NAD(P)-dependent dehydrogenase (short-subunit alcohol dehydrogenase family)
MRIAVTGANAGIGLRTVELLASDGHEVIAFVRDPARGRAAIGTRRGVRIVPLDLASPDSIRAAAEAVRGEPLDALINNAAVFDQTIRSIRRNAAGHELFWATNHLGPFELTARLSPALAQSPAPSVLFVASKGLMMMPRIRIRFDALDGEGWFTPTRAYYHSKLAQIMTAMTLAEMTGDRLDVTCVRVPAVRLDAERLAAQPAILRALYAPKNRVAASPTELAEAYVRILVQLRRARGGDLYVDEHLRGVPVPRSALDAESRRRLWASTMESTGNPAWAWEGVTGR